MEQNPLQSLYQVVQDRQKNPAEGSYTCYLFSQGLDKILKNAVRNAPKPSSPPKTAFGSIRKMRFAICCTI